VPREVVPHKVVPRETMSHEVVPHEVVPHEVVPHEMVPDVTGRISGRAGMTGNAAEALHLVAGRGAESPRGCGRRECDQQSRDGNQGQELSRHEISHGQAFMADASRPIQRPPTGTVPCHHRAVSGALPRHRRGDHACHVGPHHGICGS